MDTFGWVACNFLFTTRSVDIVQSRERVVISSLQ